jgi:hypothetical protein
MTTLIIPAAGLSTRYGLDRPKFLQQHPLGETMLVAGLRGLIGYPISRVVIVSLAEFFKDIDTVPIAAEIDSLLNTKTEFILLEKPTPSMVDTLTIGINAIEVDGPILIKDTDNFIKASIADEIGKNFVTFANLQEFPSVTAANKSFVEHDPQGVLTNIAEKQIVSNLINTGLIGFSLASDFLRASNSIMTANEKYVSDIVRFLISDGEQFFSVPASQYHDWGTLKDWRFYCRQFATIFVDIDGVVAENENPYGKDGKNWQRFRAIESNIEALLSGYLDGRFKIVFTTSRSENYRGSLTKQLQNAGFENCQILMGLPHAQRILINDFADSNPYPTAVAVNLPRNDNSLAKYLNISSAISM